VPDWQPTVVTAGQAWLGRRDAPAGTVVACLTLADVTRLVGRP
jgi:hypothetical protein